MVTNQISTFTYILFCSLISVLVVACSNTSGTDLKVPIRDIEVFCSEASLNQCGPSGQDLSVFVYLSSDLLSGCETILSLATSNSSSYAAVGNARLVYDAALGGLIATVTSWYTADNYQSLTTLPTTTYNACAFIDSNANSIFDFTEIVGLPLNAEQGINISMVDNAIIDWRSQALQLNHHTFNR